MTDISHRTFARMTDEELFAIFKDRPDMTQSSINNANRECRKRAKIAGLDGPRQWLESMEPVPSDRPRNL